MEPSSSQGDADAFAHMIAEVESWATLNPSPPREDDMDAGEPDSAPVESTTEPIIGFDGLDDLAPPPSQPVGSGLDLLDMFDAPPTAAAAPQSTEPTAVANLLGDFEDSSVAVAGTASAGQGAMALVEHCK